MNRWNAVNSGPAKELNSKNIQEIGSKDVRVVDLSTVVVGGVGFGGGIGLGEVSPHRNRTGFTSFENKRAPVLAGEDCIHPGQVHAVAIAVDEGIEIVVLNIGVLRNRKVGLETLGDT